MSRVSQHEKKKYRQGGKGWMIFLPTVLIVLTAYAVYEEVREERGRKRTHCMKADVTWGTIIHCTNGRKGGAKNANYCGRSNLN